MLCTSERKILRKIYGPIQDKGHWHPRWNSENHNLYKDLNIVDDIKIGRLRWTGNIIRMEDERILKRVLNGKFHNIRPVEKPRKRWEDTVQGDTSQILGIQGWRRQTEDREEWKSLLRVVMPWKGCCAIDGWTDV